MAVSSLIVLIAVFFLTSVIGVVTGSNSLIAVPVMFQLGIDPKVAVATNMFGLTFMAVGGSIPFVRQGRVDLKRISPLMVVTAVSSAIGAALVGMITGDTLKLVVTVGMIAVVVFTLARQQRGDTARPTSGAMAVIAIVLTFLLGVYGGLYSGGYVTVLTATLVAFYGMSYTASVAATKVINVVSSSIATLVFMWQGLVDYRLGLILGVAMFAGAYIGAHYATRLDETWIRRIFLTAVLLLALKMIIDLITA